MSDDLSEVIENAASSPAAASVDGKSATARPIGDLIAAAKHLQAQGTATKPKLGLQYRRFTYAGPEGPRQ